MILQRQNLNGKNDIVTDLVLGGTTGWGIDARFPEFCPPDQYTPSGSVTQLHLRQNESGIIKLPTVACDRNFRDYLIRSRYIFLQEFHTVLLLYSCTTDHLFTGMVYLEDTIGRNIVFQVNHRSTKIKSKKHGTSGPCFTAVPDFFDASVNTNNLKGGCWFAFRNRKMSTIVKTIIEIFIDDVSTVLVRPATRPISRPAGRQADKFRPSTRQGPRPSYPLHRKAHVSLAKGTVTRNEKPWISINDCLYRGGVAMDHPSGRVQFPSFLTGIHPTIGMNTLLSFYRMANTRIYWTWACKQTSDLTVQVPPRKSPGHPVRPQHRPRKSTRQAAHPVCKPQVPPHSPPTILTRQGRSQEEPQDRVRSPLPHGV